LENAASEGLTCELTPPIFRRTLAAWQKLPLAKQRSRLGCRVQARRLRYVPPPSSTPASFIAATIWNSSPNCPTPAWPKPLRRDEGPPFNSNRNCEVFWGETKEKRAFEDRHESTRAYIDYMRPRCVQLARVLKKTGSFYYHCDWHASHYVKVMLDQILEENNSQIEMQ